jgi:hypothetical protein
MRNWILAAAVAAVLVAGPCKPPAAQAADDFESFELVLGKTRLKLSEVLEGDGSGRKPTDKLKFSFEVPPSIGDLEAGDRIAFALTGYDAEGVTGRTVSLGDRVSELAQDYITLVDAGNGRLKCDEDETIGGFRAKLKYRRIRYANPGKGQQKARDGRLLINLTRGLFPLLPYVIGDIFNPERAFHMDGLALLTDLLVLRAALTLRLGCYRDDFSFVGVLLYFQRDNLRILRAKMTRR